MGKKRPLSPSSSQSELLLPSLKQSKLDTFLLSTQDSNLIKADSLLASPPPLDGLPDSPQPFQPVGGEPSPCEMRCHSAKLLEKHSVLTAETVSGIYAQISSILDLLKKQHTILTQILLRPSALTSIPDPVIQPTDPLQVTRTDVSSSKTSTSTATTSPQLVYQARAAVISLHQTDLHHQHPSWSNSSQIRSHLAALLRIPMSSVDLMTFTRLSLPRRTSRLLLEFRSDFIPGRLFAASNTLHRKGVFPHRFFRNLTVSNLLPTQSPLTRRVPSAVPPTQLVSSIQNDPLPSPTVAPLIELESPSLHLPTPIAARDCIVMDNTPSSNPEPSANPLLIQPSLPPVTQTKPESLQVPDSLSVDIGPPSSPSPPPSQPPIPFSPICIIKKTTLTDSFSLVDASSQFPPPLCFDLTIPTTVPNCTVPLVPPTSPVHVC